MSTGQRIKATRKTQKMSMRKLSDSIRGLSLTRLGQIEQGSIDPTLDEIERIASVLNVRSFELMGYSVDEFELMRQELTDAGYKVDEYSTGWDYMVKALFCPDGSLWHYDTFYDDDTFIPIAYQYMLKQQAN